VNVDRGIAPVPRLLGAGVTVALGTDGAVSSNSLDVLGAVRQGALVHKSGGDATAVGAEQAVRMAAIEGARALRPLHDPWSTLAYVAHSAGVRDAVVDGRVLMRDRGLRTLDEGAVLADLEIPALS
jgi:5-methylthioadenosine/S-adenosylhomocysteine deaminase